MLAVTGLADIMDLLEDSKQATEVLSETMNSVCYMYDADFRDPRKLHDAGAREWLVESIELMLCDHFYYVRRQSEL